METNLRKNSLQIKPSMHVNHYFKDLMNVRSDLVLMSISYYSFVKAFGLIQKRHRSLI